MVIYSIISQLISQGIETDLIQQSDSIYVRNQILGLLHLTQFESAETEITDSTIPDLLEDMVEYAIDHNIIEDIFSDKEILTANIMNCFISKPAEINEKFAVKYQESPKSATDYFYNLSKNSNYIQMNRINKNIDFKSKTPYGEMDITINMSKPEKDPEQIKRKKKHKQVKNYPKCLLCIENEGYSGHVGHPARANHRVINVPLKGENWYLQYSPYVYYNEHSIILAEEHRDMKITKDTFDRLVDFVQQFPHYFIGSNADLPIVGGSILSHDHYQGGNYEFAMDKAESQFTFRLTGFSHVEASVVKWPLSVIRLQSSNSEDLVNAAEHILTTWKQYSDESVNIIAYSNNTKHNTITPIAKMNEDKLQLDLVLRNNRTSDKYPNGIFHPHEDVHHIKKENIGLIEVMGLAVLPPRLKQELESIQRDLLGERIDVPKYHQDWVKSLKESYQNITSENIDTFVEQELGNKFTKALEDAGVFKQNEQGQKAFKKFIDVLNQSKE